MKSNFRVHKLMKHPLNKHKDNSDDGRLSQRFKPPHKLLGDNFTVSNFGELINLSFLYDLNHVISQSLHFLLKISYPNYI